MAISITERVRHLIELLEQFGVIDFKRYPGDLLEVLSALHVFRCVGN